MTEQDKARAYEKALEKARNYYSTTDSVADAELIELIFPELKECEGEQHRKWILEYLYDGLRKSDEQFKDQFKAAIAWLEKQTERKSNVIIPKFKIGDWVVFNNKHHDSVYQVEEIGDYEYRLRHIFGGSMPLSFSHEEMVRPWSIKDAEEGDVLFIGIDGSTCIFKKLEGNHLLYSYIISDGKLLVEDSHYYYEISDDVHPATKEQRDTFFTKIKEAGYKWNAAKKELKKIKQSSVGKASPKFHEGEWTVSNLDGKARQISEVHFDEYNSYYVVDGKSVNLEEYDRLHHPWCVADAKDGDVLVSTWKGHSYIYIFKEIESNAIVSHVYYYSELDVIDMGVITMANTPTVPATKEQRDTLIKAMANAGWEFDFDKKELKKIGQSPAEEYSFNVESELFQQLTKEQQALWRKEVEQAYNAGMEAQKPSEWSREDECAINVLKNIIRKSEVIDSIIYTDSLKERLYDWLKSLRPQPKSEWSEEDEKFIW